MKRVIKVLGFVGLIIFLWGQMAYAGSPFGNPLSGLKNTFKVGTGLAGRIPGSGLVRGAAGGISRVSRDTLRATGAAGRWGFNNVARPVYRSGRDVVSRGIKPVVNWAGLTNRKTDKPEKPVSIATTPASRRNVVIHMSSKTSITKSTVTPTPTATPTPRRNVEIHMSGKTSITRSTVTPTPRPR